MDYSEIKNKLLEVVEDKEPWDISSGDYWREAYDRGEQNLFTELIAKPMMDEIKNHGLLSE